MKTAPHFGHLIFVSLATPAHPKENTAKRNNTIKNANHFFIATHLLWNFVKQLSEIGTKVKKKMKLSRMGFTYFAVFFVVFFVVFLVPHPFVPQAIRFSPPLAVKILIKYLF